MITTECTRVALDEITRREDVARAATPGPWMVRGRWITLYVEAADDESPLVRLPNNRDSAFIALNDPPTVLAGLARDRATLERHHRGNGRECGWDGLAWPCPDAAALLDHYAPEGNR